MQQTVAGPAVGIGTVVAYCLVFLLFALAHHQAFAQAVGEPSRHTPDLIEFDIPAMSLSDALERFALQTGVSVAVDVEHMHRQTSPVQGRMAPDQALARLLRGTGLNMRSVGSGSVVVYLPKSESAKDGVVPLPVTSLSQYELAGVEPGNPAHRQYATQLQSVVIAALCESALTRPGAYRLALQLRVGEQGQIMHHKRLDTSGNPVRDQRIDQLLPGLRVGSEPPAGLAQPILMLVLPASATTRPRCHASGGAG